MTETANMNSNCPDCGATKEERTVPFGTALKTFLFPTCDCEAKKEAAEQEAKKAEQLAWRDRKAKEDAERRYRDAGILRGMMGMTLDKWRLRPELAASAGIVAQYADNLKENVAQGKGLMLTGGPGNGKTHMATAIVHEALKLGIPAEIAIYPDLMQSLRPGSAEPDETEQRYREIDLLVIDDLGKGKHSDWVEEVIYRIVNYRVLDLRAIIVTTNLDQKGMERLIGQATVDRILQVCQPVKFEAKSVRQSIRKGGV